MMTAIVTETFFLASEVDRQEWSVPAEIYNRYRSLLTRNQVGNVFVPIRGMQFMAVLDHDEIVFVDSQSYAVSGDEGGRLILIAWKFAASHERNALGDPVPCEVVFYGAKNDDTQLRLVSEFRQSMELIDRRYRDKQLPVKGAKILFL
jgi:hypothetical protein